MTVGSTGPVATSAASNTTTAVFVPSERTTAIREPSGDQDGKPNWALLVSETRCDDPSVATIERDPSVSWTAIEPDDAIGWSADPETAGPRLAGAPLAWALADVVALGETAALADGAAEGDGVGLAQPATTIARMAAQATPRFDLIGQRYAPYLPSDARGAPSMSRVDRQL